MNKIIFLMAYAFIIMGIVSCANEIDYANCKSIQDVIIKETQEIAITHPANHDELAQLYVSRGESYLLDAQYEKAVEDFQNANAYLRCSNAEGNTVIAFRTAFGEVVSYENLGMHEETQQALLQLQTIVSHVGCDDCAEHHSRQDMILSSKNKVHFQDKIRSDKNIENLCNRFLTCKGSQDYSDILGPDQPPESD